MPGSLGVIEGSCHEVVESECEEDPCCELRPFKGGLELPTLARIHKLASAFQSRRPNTSTPTLQSHEKRDHGECERRFGRQDILRTAATTADRRRGGGR